jgi:hypothetical protein
MELYLYSLCMSSRRGVGKVELFIHLKLFMLCRKSCYLLAAFLFIRVDGQKYFSLDVFPQSFLFIFLPALSSVLMFTNT